MKKNTIFLVDALEIMKINHTYQIVDKWIYMKNHRWLREEPPCARDVLNYP
jgi:hypothetical protein